jgi:hypothetical protein
MSRHQKDEGDREVLPTHEHSNRARQWSRVPNGYVREATPSRTESAGNRIPNAESGNAGNLEHRSREELFRIARYLGIEGRSSMTREELLDRIRKLL